MDTEELKQFLVALQQSSPGAAAREFGRLIETIRGEVLGMVRAKVPRADQDDVVQDVMIKILVSKPRWDPRGGVDAFFGYLRMAVKSAAADYFRRSSGPRAKPRKEDFEWLFEMTRGGCMAPPKALVGAIHVLLGAPIETIAADLAEKPMRELADMLQKEYKGTARFDELIRNLDGPAGEQSLNGSVPARTSRGRKAKSGNVGEFERWVRFVQRCAENRWRSKPEEEEPQTHPLAGVPVDVACEALRELLRLADSPQKLVVFLLNKFLGLKPNEIRSRAGLPLKELYLEAKRGFHGLTWQTITAVQWDAYFAELEAKVAAIGTTTLAEFAPVIEVDHWTRHIYLQFMTRVHAQEHDFLAVVFAHDQAHQSIAYSFGDLLKETAESIWQQSNEPLRGLAGSLKSQYEERYDLAPELLDNCFHGLESRLDRFTLPAVKDATRRGECLKRGADRVGETFFSDYYVNSGKADKLGEIRNWQRRVRLRVRANIAGKGRGLLIAWVYGWLSEEGAQ